jgi:hypothetical protein
MISLITDLTKEKKPPNMQMTEFDLGFNSAIEMAISHVREYGDGSKCICCGSTEIYQMKCMECGFILGER